MTFFITTFTLITNIAFVIFVAALVFDKTLRHFVYKVVREYPLHLVLITSFSSLVFSLWYSNIIGFPPCELCWIQRICMYPQVLLSLTAIWMKDKTMMFHLLPLTIIGTIVSFYQSLVNWGFGGGLLGCTAVGGDCAKVYVLEYGYITIPFMAFSSFVYLLTISIIYFKAQKNF